MQEDYYAALASVVMASARDDTQLRSMIYDLARSKLRQQLDRQAKALSRSERAQQLAALDTAIEQVETDIGQRVSRQANARVDVLSPAGYPTAEIIPPARRLPPLSEARSDFTTSPRGRAAPSHIWSALALAATVILGTMTYVGIQHGHHGVSREKAEADQSLANNTTHLAYRPLVPIVPTPAAYGVYAVTKGQLTELQPLPIRVPDPKVATSGTISSPSTAKLPIGRAQFIVFRRNLVNKVPEKVVVRVVARVMRASASVNKEVATTSSDAQWIIRGISYDMKVAPMRGNPAMILIHPADADFSFPAGRYALAMNTVAYDFSVDGSITDLTQCVERNDEVAAAEYTECRKR